jgi:predicted RNase H-like nuclease (RuvC/YqgF family)
MLLFEMPSSEEQRTKSNHPAQPRNPGGGRLRGRRGGRGRNPTQIVKAAATEQTTLLAPEKREIQTAESPATAINKAVEEVRQIVESLEQVLEQMEEVLRLVDSAERQKFADEREIESLRRALRKIQQPRGRPQEQQQPNI